MTHSRSETRALLQRAGVVPRRSLGQNFVTEPSTVRRIVRLADVRAGDCVVEIGAGLGSLTLALVETGAQVLAVETDPRLAAILRDVVTGRADPGTVSVLHADARTLDWETVLAAAASTHGTRWQLVANLPYNIATSLVLDVLDHACSVTRLLVMCQLEAGRRLCAVAGDKSYGAVSVRVAARADARLVGTVPAAAFFPVPAVTSALVQMIRHDRRPPPETDAELTRLLRLAFGRRRQMLRRSLHGRLGPCPVAEMLASVGIDPTARPETVGLDGWQRLAAAVAAASAPDRPVPADSTGAAPCPSTPSRSTPSPAAPCPAAPSPQ